jgi:hypothetical protein
MDQHAAAAAGAAADAALLQKGPGVSSMMPPSPS